MLGALLAKLEKDKPTINLGTDDKQHCENFAVRVFTRADKIDRAGRADKTTATTYYAASIFIEVSQNGISFGQASLTCSPQLSSKRPFLHYSGAAPGSLDMCSVGRLCIKCRKLIMLMDADPAPIW